MQLVAGMAVQAYTGVSTEVNERKTKSEKRNMQRSYRTRRAQSWGGEKKRVGSEKFEESVAPMTNLKAA